MDSRHIGMLLLVAVLLSHGSASGQTWTKVSVDHVQVDFKSIVMTDSQRGWAVPSFGYTLYKTLDGGDTWTTVTVGSGTKNAIFFLDPQNGWVVGTGGQVHTTSDYGQSWQAQTSNTSQSLYSVYFLNLQRGWLVGAQGVARETTDGGQTWNTIATLGTSATLFDVFFLDSNHGWIMGNQLVRFTDDGVTWYAAASYPSSSYPAHRVRFFDAQIGLATMYTDAPSGCASSHADRVWRTTDAGLNWSSVLSTAETVVDFDMIDATTARAITQDGLVYTTNDRGANWQQSGPLFTWDIVSDVDMFDDTYGIIVGVNGTFLVTDDGGTTWGGRGTGTSWNITGIAFEDAQHGWYASDEGIFYTQDGGQHWTLRHSEDPCGGGPLFYNDIEVLPDGSILAVGINFMFMEAFALKSIDGDTWTMYFIGGFGSELDDVSFPDAQNGWAVGWGGEIWATDDGGESWSFQTSGTAQGLWGVHFIDSSQGWAVGDGGIIIHTSDGGQNWAPQANTGNNLRAVYMADAQDGWAVGVSGQIWRTTNGSLWAMQRSGGDMLYDIDFGSAQEGWAVGNNGFILYTGDGGASWSTQTSPTGDNLQDLDAWDATRAYAAGNSGEVIRYDSSPPPVAVAGPPQTVDEGDAVTLDGSGSSDPQSLPLDFLWGQTAGPAVTLQGGDQEQASFTAPAVCELTDLVFRLTVDNGTRSGSDTTQVTVLDVDNLPPQALIAPLAGPVDEESLVMLDGSGSTDDCGVIYDWVQSGGQAVQISDPAASLITFTAPQVCAQSVLSFELTVTDVGLLNDVDAIDVTVEDSQDLPPVADAGQDQTLDEGTQVTLDGSASSDDCNPLTYLWSQLSGPAVTISDPDLAQAQFTAPPVCGGDDLVFQLSVNPILIDALRHKVFNTMKLKQIFG